MIVSLQSAVVLALAAVANGLPSSQHREQPPQAHTSIKSLPSTHSSRPFYAIAHRVLTRQAVSDALAVGANALEVDFTAWKASGWWADHDGLPTSAGDSASTMFHAIAEHARDGQNINFVWLDIKNPDHCDTLSAPVCSFSALRDLAREVLQPAGVKVLYGFYDADGAAYRLIQDDLNDMEAVNLNGKTAAVVNAFNKAGPKDVARRTMAYGFFWLPFQFGDCEESDYYTCTELRQGAGSSELGLTFGWTSADGQNDLVHRLLDVGVDGLIFGLKASCFRDEHSSRSAFAGIKDWMDAHPEKRHLATAADKPW